MQAPTRQKSLCQPPRSYQRNGVVLVLPRPRLEELDEVEEAVIVGVPFAQPPVGHAHGHAHRGHGGRRREEQRQRRSHARSLVARDELLTEGRTRGGKTNACASENRSGIPVEAEDKTVNVKHTISIAN